MINMNELNIFNERNICTRARIKFHETQDFSSETRAFHELTTDDFRTLHCMTISEIFTSTNFLQITHICSIYRDVWAGVPLLAISFRPCIKLFDVDADRPNVGIVTASCLVLAGMSDIQSILSANLKHSVLRYIMLKSTLACLCYITQHRYQFLINCASLINCLCYSLTLQGYITPRTWLSNENLSFRS